MGSSVRAGHGRGARCRAGPGGWRIRARVERFTEPALLLLLRERPAHGYELLEQLPSVLGEERVDMGNLYRLLRALEEDGLVRSHWNAGPPGPARRTFELTEAGHELLAAWLGALERAQHRISLFLDRSRREVKDAPT